MARAHCAAAKQRRELQFDARGKCERAFAANQYMREVDIVFPRHQRVEIVAADAPLNFGKALGNFLRLARADSEQIFGERAQRGWYILEAAADAAEMRERAVREQ